jgi:hypothetical protein
MGSRRIPERYRRAGFGFMLTVLLANELSQFGRFYTAA